MGWILNSKSIKFNVAIINTCTEAEGPYKRMAIWFQGCNIGCKGCCNPDLQDIKPAHIISLDEMVSIAKKSKKENGIEGVTFLGGEPTLQQHLDILSNELHKLDLGIILFTGYKINQLKESFISSVDLVIDGQFIDEKIDQNRNLIGSTNQTLYPISNRYVNNMEWFTDKRNQQVDVHVSGDLLVTGDVVVNCGNNHE
jgi:anaerobic ribonucleoside-triphosphate reductase activating protein